MRSRIVAVDPAAEHGDGDPGGLERAAVRLGVDAAGEAADDDEPGGRELAAEAARDLAPVGGARTRADDRDRRSRQELDLGLAAQEEAGRRVVDRPQQRREGGIGAREEAEAERASRASSAGASKRP